MENIGKENTPPRKIRQSATSAKDALLEGDEDGGKLLEAENKGLKRKLLEYEQKVARMENDPFYQEVINLAKNANVSLAVSLSLIQSPPPAGLPPTDPSNCIESKNALQNDLIVCGVLRHLESEDLLRCRLVNHLWNSNATLHLRKFHPYIGFVSVVKVTDFVRTAKKATWSTRFPYSQFLIQNRFVPGMAAQFVLFAQYIKVLRITSTGASSSHKNSVNLHTIPAILKMMVSLEKLELSQISFPKDFPESVPEPTFTIPSLKTLQIEANFIKIHGTARAISTAENPKSDQIVQNILRIGGLKRITMALTSSHLIPKFLEALTLIPCLEELEVSSILIESHLRYLLKDPKPFALKSLQLIIQLESCTTLLRFLEGHAITLESLELHLGAFIGVRIGFLPLKQQFPHFPNLRNLKLISSLDGLIFPFYPIQEEGAFPLLSKLHLSDDVYAFFFVPTESVCVEDLILSHNPYYVLRPPRLGLLVAINDVFPNLKKVTLGTTKPCDLHGVISKYPNLESLEFGPIMHITEVLSGIPQPEWIEQGISLECEVNSLSKCFAINFLQRTAARGSGLHLLTKLKRLEIKGQRDGNCTVKDVLGYGVLLALPRLEYLAITNAELSKSCVKDLRKHHANVILKTEQLPRNKNWKHEFVLVSFT